MSLFWSMIAIMALFALLAAMAISEWPTKTPIKPFRCEKPCEDRLCSRFGCPDSPEWIGDMK